MTGIMNDWYIVKRRQPPGWEEVYGKYTDSVGNIHWFGVYSGEHIITFSNCCDTYKYCDIYKTHID